ncbi:MAG: efflux transporter, family, subunit [Polaromonas sp.]|nr:efflux transporter, family, subunit [Polaromonas sp.]
MASKAIYMVVAVAGIAAASGAAWWYQRPGTTAVDDAARASAPGPAAPAQGSAGPGGAKPPSVEIARVEVARLADETRAVGSLRSRRGVVLRPEISGRITQLNFTDGQRVRKGQLLVQFDDQLPQAQIQQSQAEMSIVQANHKRNQELVAQNFVSQRSLDESAANLQVAQAKLALARATAARLKIVAPFDGIAGIRQVNVGDYLKDGADIVNIEDIDAVYVDFRLPERFQSKVSRGQTAQLDIDALPGQRYTAQIQAIDPLIDANGRSVGVRGCIDNRALTLRPGMFARVNTVFGVRESASVIPEESILPQGGKQFVIKLLDGPTAQTRTTQRVEVRLGLRSPGKVEVMDGLAPGDTVVRTGQQRIQKDGTVVTVVDLANGGNGGVARAPAATAAASAAAAPASAPPAATLAGSAGKAEAPAGQAALAPAAPDPSAKSAAKAATPAGPNPCGTIVSQAPTSSPAHARSPGAHEKPSAAPAVRNPG